VVPEGNLAARGHLPHNLRIAKIYFWGIVVRQQGHEELTSRGTTWGINARVYEGERNRGGRQGVPFSLGGLSHHLAWGGALPPRQKKLKTGRSRLEYLRLRGGSPPQLKGSGKYTSRRRGTLPSGSTASHSPARKKKEKDPQAWSNGNLFSRVGAKSRRPLPATPPRSQDKLWDGKERPERGETHGGGNQRRGARRSTLHKVLGQSAGIGVRGIYYSRASSHPLPPSGESRQTSENRRREGR